MLNDELRNLFKGREKDKHPKWNKFPTTGKKFIKEINNLNCNLVLDLGCGQNPYKGRINNLIGRDILDNANLPVKYIDKDQWGVDVITGKKCNMIKSGIIDPLLVTKTALKNAASVATTILSTDCVINNLRANESSGE